MPQKDYKIYNSKPEQKYRRKKKEFKSKYQTLKTPVSECKENTNSKRREINQKILQ